MTFKYITEFIVTLALLIIVHELGHFIACRLFKLEVEEFGIGLPPRALRMFNWKGTDFTLNWIPLGGFVKPRGETDPEVPGGLASAKPLVRIGVALAGPSMNLLLAVILYSAMFMIVGEPDPARLDEVEIQGVMADSPALNAGLEYGDIVLSINGEPITTVEQARGIIYAHLDKEIIIRYQRDGQESELTLVPLSSRTAEEGATGVQMGSPQRAVGLGGSILNGFKATYQHCVLLLDFLGKLITGRMDTSTADVVGPIGMGRMYVGLRENSPVSGIMSSLDVLAFIVSVTVSLGLFNLLPIPALDGGRIILAIPELITRKRINPKIENWLITASFLLLLAVLIVASFRDVFFPIVQ